MLDLFKAEWRRFGAAAGLLAVVHVLVLGFIDRLSDLAQQPVVVYRAIGAVYMLVGVLLGLYQTGSYRRPNAWMHLLHRPLAGWRIAAALSGAGVVLMLVVIALPVLAIAGFQATVTARVVDLRHWLLPLASLLIATAGYLAGTYAMLAPRRHGWCVLVLLAYPALAQASGAMAMLGQALVVAWLAAMVAVAFKPDPGASPTNVASSILMALPVQMSMYLVALLLGFGVEIVWIMQGTHPTNMVVPPAGGTSETERMTGVQRMLAGLATSDRPEAPLWREQIALSEVFALRPQLRTVPTRQELMNTTSLTFDDETSRERWVFSHDRMAFEGYRLTDGRRVGEVGIAGAMPRFEAVASPVGPLPGWSKADMGIIAGNHLYHYIADLHTITPRIGLPTGEYLAGISLLGDHLAVVSNRALYIFDGKSIAEDEAPMVPRQRVPLPGKLGDLGNLDVIELVDGYLASFTFTWQAYNAEGSLPRQVMVWTDDTGKVATVGTRSIAYDFPALYRYQSWWPSPALSLLRATVLRLFATPDPFNETSPAKIPGGIRWLAFALSVVSLLAGILLALRRPMKRRLRMAWIVACGALGLPALISLLLIYPNAPRVPSRVANAAGTAP